MPTRSFLAREDRATKTLSPRTVADARATERNACAVPAGFESTWRWIVCVPMATELAAAAPGGQAASAIALSATTQPEHLDHFSKRMARH